MGWYWFTVTPWRSGVTLWNMDMWQGRVTEGSTVRASRVQAPMRRISSAKGWPQAVNPSGRMPSMEIRITLLVMGGYLRV